MQKQVASHLTGIFKEQLFNSRYQSGGSISFGNREPWCQAHFIVPLWRMFGKNLNVSELCFLVCDVGIIVNMLGLREKEVIRKECLGYGRCSIVIITITIYK